MTNNSTSFIDQNARSHWVRLRTLVMVRWVAIAGQVSALIVAQWAFDLVLPLGLCGLAIGFSVVGNIIATTVYPDNRRLSETEILFMLLFDILQLGFLLALTGGLNNPFALLVLAPITIAANVLPTRLTALISAVGLVIVAGAWLFYIPLRTEDGFILRVPDVFSFGNLVAIETSILFIAVYTRRVTTEMTAMAEALLATQMALAREQKLTDLGGVVAATAHELGTPLATIKLVSAELIEDLEDHPDMLEDAKLIRQQADRCKDILQSMGRAGKDDTHLKSAPWSAIIEEAAEPHINRGKIVHYEITTPKEFLEDHPIVFRKPEIIHGLRNLIQNAVDFASAEVLINIKWTEKTISIKISDDGQGFRQQTLNRIGEPFLRQRGNDGQYIKRPGYDGMGLGLFIAKTLLERSGGKITFRNSTDQDQGVSSGAIVSVIWSKSDLIVNNVILPQNSQFPI